jgi:dihydroorotate dehydrogenase electron transfer subunit
MSKQFKKQLEKQLKREQKFSQLHEKHISEKLEIEHKTKLFHLYEEPPVIKSDTYPVLKNENIAEGIYSLEFAAPDIAQAAVSGQFAMVKADGFSLRRPISICDVNGDIVRLVYEIRGGGTQVLSQIKKGDNVDVIAPLGNGYPVIKDKRVLLCGGGIGVPPLLYAGKVLVQNNCTVTAYLGFREQNKVILENDFEQAGVHTQVFVGGTFTEKIVPADYDCIFACGPTPMLKSIAAMSAPSCTVYVSLEEHMACGMGACVGCVTKTADGYRRVCKDGPVFDAGYVEW